MNDPPNSVRRERRYWLDDRRNVDRLAYTLYAVCAGLFLADLLYQKHVHFGFEHWVGFHGWYGFLSYVCLIFLAKGLRKLVKRREDYYDD